MVKIELTEDEAFQAAEALYEKARTQREIAQKEGAGAPKESAIGMLAEALIQSAESNERLAKKIWE